VEVIHQYQGENLMLRRVLLNLEIKATEEPQHRKRVFKTKCNIWDKCCHLDIDCRST
jgi:hypothetical protein